MHHRVSLALLILKQMLIDNRTARWLRLEGISGYSLVLSSYPNDYHGESWPKPLHPQEIFQQLSSLADLYFASKTHYRKGARLTPPVFDLHATLKG